MHAGHVAIDERHATELRMRELVREAGLPEPDEVEYRDTSIVLFWHEEKLVVEVDEIPVDAVGGGEYDGELPLPDQRDDLPF